MWNTSGWCLGGITCDSHDYYDSEEHINEVFLPKIMNGEPLYVGFFHTGAYQDQISGYGGIKHCLIPSPKHMIVGMTKTGNWWTGCMQRNKRRKAC